jgi:protein involved in polysaccharide export with SLBB domain
MLERVKRLAARERERATGRPLVAPPEARPESQADVPAGVPEEARSAIRSRADGEERRPVEGGPAPQASPGPFWLGAGDEVDIVVGGQPEFSGVVAVRDDGKVALPTTGDLVEATGLSTEEFGVGVAAALHPRYLKRKPRVSVVLQSSPRLVYYVFGAVRWPGTHAMPPAGITVLDAVLAASSGQRRRPDRVASRAGETSDTFEPVRGARYGRVHVVPPDGAPVRIVDLTSAMQGGPGLLEKVVPGSRVIVPERSGQFSEAELKRRLYPDGLVAEGGAQ